MISVSGQHLFLGDLLGEGDLFFLAKRIQMFPHVRVHVGQIDVQLPVVVEVEDLDSHGSPWRRGKQLATLLDETATFNILVILIMALHVGQIQVRPSIVVGIKRAGVARPTHILQTHLVGDVDESVSALVPIEDAGLRERGIKVSVEGVRGGTIVGILGAVRPGKRVMDDRLDFVRCINAYIYQE